MLHRFACVGVQAQAVVTAVVVQHGLQSSPCLHTMLVSCVTCTVGIYVSCMRRLMRQHTKVPVQKVLKVKGREGTLKVEGKAVPLTWEGKYPTRGVGPDRNA